MTYDDTEDTEPFEVMNTEQPVFTCPSCGKNVFDVGVTECATGADISTVIRFNESNRTPYIATAEHRWIKCDNCHNSIKNMTVNRLDAVFSGNYTEEQMKTKCGIIQRPVFLCPSCKLNLFKEGIYEVTRGGISKAQITFCSDGTDASDVMISDITEQWSECSNCGARIDIDAINLIDYYEGECSLEDINSE